MLSAWVVLYRHEWSVALQCFPASFIKATIVGGKKVIEHKMCVFIFSTTFVWNISHSMVNSARHSLINVHASSCKLRFILEFSRHIFEKHSNIKFHENPSSGSQVVPCGRTYQTDMTNFKAVHSVDFLSPCTKFIAPTTCKVLIIYTY